jgi:rhodanese-related sulfurtransferase
VRLAPEKETLLAERAVQIHPGELLTSLADNQLNIVMLDVRDEADYNLFHIRRARHLPLDDVAAAIPALQLEAAANTVYVLMSNDETAATEAWKLMVAESVPNVYILEGGLNNWLTVFGHDDPTLQPTPDATGRRSVAVHVHLGAGRPLCRRRPGPASLRAGVHAQDSTATEAGRHGRRLWLICPHCWIACAPIRSLPS